MFRTGGRPYRRVDRSRPGRLFRYVQYYSRARRSDLPEQLDPDVRLSLRGAGPGEGGRDRSPPCPRLRPRAGFSKKRLGASGHH